MGWQSLVTALAPSVLSFIGGERRNSAQSALNDKQMAFQERMSNTQYQRGVADMRAAGLNPMLAATRGVSTSSPQGSQPVIQDTITPAVNSAQVASQTVLNWEQKRKVFQETALATSNISLNNAQIVQLNTIVDRIRQEIVGIKAENVQKVIEAKLFEDYETLAKLKAMGFTIGSASQFLTVVLGKIGIGKLKGK